MKSKIFFVAVLFLTIIITSCKDNDKVRITDSEDYNAYIKQETIASLDLANEELHFWTNKYNASPNQLPFMSKMAAMHTQRFMISGTIDDLLKAEDYLIKLNDKTNYDNAGYLRAIARNYISQHKFKNALEVLLKAKENGENLKATEKMLFDLYLELGNEEEAKSYLLKIKNFSDFDYLIRLSKYNDHKGNLDAAIKYLEKAKVIAESSNIDATKQWTYTNLADYYGHAGRIKDSYSHYIKALEINPNDAYAKKGIAWIIYSYERNPTEALRVLNTITDYNISPDYNLLKSEIADFMDNSEAKEMHLVNFLDAVSDVRYGDMYNAYKIELYSDDNSKTEEALQLAIAELNNRKTPQTYDLLAWSYFKNGDTKKALDIIEKHVVKKTFEPVAMYHLAEVYKANGKMNAAQELKQELLDAAYELGPVMEQSIKKI